MGKILHRIYFDWQAHNFVSPNAMATRKLEKPCLKLEKCDHFYPWMKKAKKMKYCKGKQGTNFSNTQICVVHQLLIDQNISYNSHERFHLCVPILHTYNKLCRSMKKIVTSSFPLYHSCIVIVKSNLYWEFWSWQLNSQQYIFKKAALNRTIILHLLNKLI